MQLVSNRYKAGELIGKGGMGEVYTAEDMLRPGITFALKIVRKDLFSKFREISMEILRQETEVMTRLKHPNLVQVYDFGVFGSDYFIVMEYIEGKLLNEFIENKDLFSSDKELLDIMVEFLRALEFIHSRYVIYRDIKPSNAIISRSGTLKLMDFGIADIFHKKEDAVKGTFYYIAPEVLTGKIDYRIDIFSLGILFYELWTGEYFYDRKGILMSQISEILRNEQSYSRYKKRKTDTIANENMKYILNKMLSHDCSKRYRNCHEIIGDINRLSGSSYDYETFLTKESYVLGNLFIDRKKEFKHLKKALSSKSKYSIYVCCGNSGSGKTRLFSEFKKYCKLNEIYFFEANCTEARLNYHVISEILLQVIIYTSENTVHRYGSFLRYILPGFERLLSFTPTDMEDKKLLKEIISHKISDFLVEFLLENKSPIVFCIDDLQWIDMGSAGILAEFFYKAGKVYMREKSLLNSTFFAGMQDMPQKEAFLESLFKTREIFMTDLCPFGNKDVREYIRSIFGSHSINKGLISSSEWIREMVGGNPLYLCEFIKALLERNFIIREEKSWDLRKGFNSADLPENITDIMEKNIKSIFVDLASKEILELMSLLRIDPSLNELQHFFRQRNNLDVLQQLLLLERLEIIRSYYNEKKLCFRLNNYTVKKIIRKGILQKRAINNSIAESLEYLYQSLMDSDYTEEIAYHYYEGRNRQKAFEFYVKSGDNYQKNYFCENAVFCYSRALKLIKNDDNNFESNLEISLKKASCLEVQGKFNETSRILKQCIALSKRINNTYYYGKSLSLLGNVLIKTNRYEEAEKYLKLAGRTLKKLPQKKAYLNNILYEGNLYNFQSQYDKAMRRYRQAERLFRETGDIHGISKAVGNMGSIYYYRGNYEKALHCFRSKKELCEKLDDMPGISQTLGAMGDMYELKGDYNKAMTCFNEKMDLCEKIGDKRGIAFAFMSLGGLYLNRNDYQKAMQHYMEARIIYREIGDRMGYCYATGNMANICYNKGNLGRAMQYYQKAKEICEDLNDKRGYSQIVGNMGNIFFDRNEFHKAEECYLSQRNICREIGDRRGYGQALSNLGNICLKKGDLAKAMIYFKSHETLSRKLDDLIGYSHAIAKKGSVYEIWGNYSKALELYGKARSIREKLGDKKGLSYLCLKTGEVYEMLGEFHKALEYYESSLEEKHSFAGRREHYNTAVCMASLYSKTNNINKSLINYNKAIKLAKTFGNKTDLCRLFVKKAYTLFSAGKREAADLCLEKAISLSEETSVKDICFDISLLKIKLRGDNDIVRSSDLQSMLSSETDDHNKALLLYELSMLSGHKKHLPPALALYRQIYKKNPKYEYKKRIEELSLLI